MFNYYTYFIIINLIGCMAMFIDKQKAIHNKWRIREGTLIGLAALGGSIGILVGMYGFHHKTLHKKFTIGVPLILIMQIFLLIQWLL